MSTNDQIPHKWKRGHKITVNTADGKQEVAKFGTCHFSFYKIHVFVHGY